MIHYCEKDSTMSSSLIIRATQRSDLRQSENQASCLVTVNTASWLGWHMLSTNIRNLVSIATEQLRVQ